MQEEENNDSQKPPFRIMDFGDYLREAYPNQLDSVMEEVNNILAEKSTDTDRIEHALDTLRELILLFELGEKEFLDFLQYVYTVDEDLAFRSFSLYKEEKEAQEEDDDDEEDDDEGFIDFDDLKEYP